jgi:hypothetical protein
LRQESEQIMLAGAVNHGARDRFPDQDECLN